MHNKIKIGYRCLYVHSFYDFMDYSMEGCGWTFTKYHIKSNDLILRVILKDTEILKELANV